MKRISREECINTEAATRKEWLDANGIGGYASSTVINCHTRKYHGLLVAALKQPRGRFVLLSKVEEALIAPESQVNPGREFALSTNKYPGVYHPTGHQFQEWFEQDLYPVAAYRIGDALVLKSVLLVHGRNTVLVRYELAEGAVRPMLRLRPLLACRDIHALTRENMFLRPKTWPEKNGRKVQPYEGMPPLYMATSRASEFFPGPRWFRNVEYLKERDRGFDYQEDLFCPGMFEMALEKGKPVIFAASVEPVASGGLTRLFMNEVKRRETEFAACADRSAAVQRLKYASRQFLVRNQSGFDSVIAGYHWFGEWGRDTMISLPGLTFHAGARETGERVLGAYAELERDGLLPNYLDQSSDHLAYNSVDASLWFFWAAQECVASAGRKGGAHARAFVARHVFPALKSIVAAHLDGRVPLCRLDGDCLLHAGDSGTQLTWMDAQAHGRPVTPRHGAAVEINALWYNALRFFAECAAWAGDGDTALMERAVTAADTLASRFVGRFWNHEDNCLSDVVDDGGQDHSIRPNQIFAASLPYSMLDTGQMRAVVGVVQSHLLTPFGLRTLSPRNPAYRPFYHGDADERDSAYHQGMVWPWLAGHFGQALLRQAEDTAGAKAFLRKYFRPILRTFPDDYGIGSLPEIYSGNPPHRPDGCVAQAWSVAEAIRLNKILGSR